MILSDINGDGDEVVLYIACWQGGQYFFLQFFRRLRIRARNEGMIVLFRKGVNG